MLVDGVGPAVGEGVKGGGVAVGQNAVAAGSGALKN